MKKTSVCMTFLAGLILAGSVQAEVLFADDFNRADGNLAGTTTSVGGYTWGVNVGGGTAFQIHNGQLEVTPTSQMQGVVVGYDLDKVAKYTVSFDLTAKSHAAGVDKTHLHYQDRYDFGSNEEWYGYVASCWDGVIYGWFSPSWADVNAQSADTVMHVSILNEGNQSTWTINSTTYAPITIYAQANDGVVDNIYFGAYTAVDVGMAYIIDNLVVTALREPTYIAFSPTAGTYDEAQTAVITCETADAAIYYTTDGTDPSSTNGKQIASGASVLVDHSLTLKAIAVVNGTAGSIYQAAYVINHQNAAFNVPAIASINVNGDLADWPASTDWSLPYITWAGGGLTSTTRAKFAWNDATDMLYVAIETNQTSETFPGGHAVVGLSKNLNGIPTSGLGATQLCFDTVAGGNEVLIRNEIQYYKDEYTITAWGGGTIDGVQAKYSFNSVTGYYTYEIAIPLWADWRPLQAKAKQSLSVGDAVYLYSVMESGLETAIGTDLTWNGNPGFAYGAFNKATTLTLAGPAAIPGDANGDNKVDVSDLGILAANYGTTAGATWSTGDFSHDGRVDVSDLGILAANYGTGTGAALDFNADAKALGLTVGSEDIAKDQTPVTSTLGCGSAGLPLIAGLFLMGLFLIKLDE